MGGPRSSTPTRAASSPATTSPACCTPMGLPSAWTAAAALPITSSSNGSGAVSSTRRSTSKPTRTWPRRGKVSPPTSSSTTTNDCTRRWLTAPRARSSTKQRHLPIRRGGKTLARAQHYQHNEMQTWAGFLTLQSPDRCLEDRVHLTQLYRLRQLYYPYRTWTVEYWRSRVSPFQALSEVRQHQQI